MLYVLCPLRFNYRAVERASLVLMGAVLACGEHVDTPFHGGRGGTTQGVTEGECVYLKL